MRKFLAILVVVVIGLTLWLVWPRNENELVLYSAVDYGPLVARDFTNRTGIKVRVVTSSTGQLLARIIAEGNRPSWDIAWFDGAIAASSLDEDHFLASIPIDASQFNPEGTKILPGSHRWIPTGYTLSGVFVYRKGGVSPPGDFSDLLSEMYHDRVGMNNPSISGPTFPLVAGMLRNNGGWPAGRTFLEKLAGNGLHVFAKNRYTLQGLKEGKIQIAMVQSSAGYALVSKDSNVYAVEIPKHAYILPRVMVVSRKISSKKMRIARMFINYALSKDATRECMKHGNADGFFWPVTTDFTYRRSVLPDARNMGLLDLNPAYWGGLEATINTWFSNRMVSR